MKSTVVDESLSSYKPIHCSREYQASTKDKYIEMYNEFISQLHNYVKAIRILVKGYLPITLITLLKLQEILALVKETLSKQTQTVTLL